MKKISLLLLIMFVIFLSSCSGGYSFTNPTYPDDIDFNATEIDENIALDGKLDESFYDDLDALSFSSPQDETQQMSLKAYFGELGLLIGIERVDSKVYYDSNRQIFKNDSVEVYINPTNSKTTLTKDYIQLRVSAINTKESWIGTPSPDGYPWSYYFLPFMSAASVDGTVIDSFEKDIDQNRQSNGYFVEIFVSWGTLGLQEKPDTIDIFPAFVDAFGLGSNEYRWNGHGLAHNNPSAYVTFNHQKPGSEAGNVFGDSQFGIYGTAGFEVQNDDILVRQTGGYDQFTFFKNVYGSKYGFSVEISNIDILNNDQYPKVGVIVGQNEDELLVFLLDPFVNYDNFYGVLVPRERVDGVWQNWGWNDGIPLPIGFDYHEKNKITVVRDDVYVYIFVNDQFIVKREHEFEDDTQAGLYTMNMTATYTNYVIHNEATLDNLILASETPENDTFINPTPGFDIAENGATQNGGYDQWVYLKEVNSELYGFSVNVSDLVILNNDQFPKVGVIIGQDNQRILNYFLDPFVGFNNYYGLIVEGGKTGSTWGEWQWPDGVVLPVGFSYQNTNKITVLRDETDVYILVNDTFVQKQAHGFEGPSQAGFFTMNMHADYSDLSIFDTADVEIMIDQILNQSGEVFDRYTAGFDMNDELSVNQNGLGVQYAYLKDAISTQFIASTYVTIGSNLNDDQTPKIGMVTDNGAGGLIGFFMDPHATKDWKDILIVRKPAGSDWNWPGDAIWIDELDFDNPIKMTIVRDGLKMYYFINDTLIYQGNTINSLASQPGLMTMYHTGLFENTNVSTNSSDVANYLDNYIFSPETNFGWSGSGNYTINETSVFLNGTEFEVAEPFNFIENESLNVSGDFFINFTVSDVTYISQAAPGIEVWPKLSFVLIQENGIKDYISFGADLEKQNRIETKLGDWVNWEVFEQVDWQDGFDVRIERQVVGSVALISIYVNDQLMQVTETTNVIEYDYLGSYHIGLTFNHASGLISNITSGSLVE